MQGLRTGQLKSVFESFPCHLATVGLGQVILYLCALFSLVVNRDNNESTKVPNPIEMA